jgi:hypothetical protein
MNVVIETYIWNLQQDKVNEDEIIKKGHECMIHNFHLYDSRK